MNIQSIKISTLLVVLIALLIGTVNAQNDTNDSTTSEQPSEAVIANTFDIVLRYNRYLSFDVMPFNDFEFTMLDAIVTRYSMYSGDYREILFLTIMNHFTDLYGLSGNLDDVSIIRPSGQTIYTAYVVGYNTSCSGDFDYTIGQVPPYRTQPTAYGTVYLDAPITLHINDINITQVRPYSNYHGSDRTLAVNDNISEPTLGFNAEDLMPAGTSINLQNDIHRRWHFSPPDAVGLAPWIYVGDLETVLPEIGCANAVRFLFIHPDMPQLDLPCWLPLAFGPEPDGTTYLCNAFLPEAIDMEETDPDEIMDDEIQDESIFDYPEELEIEESNQDPISARPGETVIIDFGIGEDVPDDAWIQLYVDGNDDGVITPSDGIISNLLISGGTNDIDLPLGFTVPDVPSGTQVDVVVHYGFDPVPNEATLPSEGITVTYTVTVE